MSHNRHGLVTGRRHGYGVMQTCIRQLNDEAGLGSAMAEWDGTDRPWSGRFELPLDLGDWFPLEAIAGWVREEVEQFDWSETGVSPDAGSKCGERSLLSLLAVAYVTREFDAQGIVSACRQNTVFRGLCPGAVPFAHELTRFRRRYAGLLVTVVARLFGRALRERCDWPATDFAAGINRCLHEQAVERLDIGRLMDRGTCE
jgi:hypothetical protein